MENAVESLLKLWHEQAKFLGTTCVVVLGALAGFVYSDAERYFGFAAASALFLFTSIISCLVFSCLVVGNRPIVNWGRLPLFMRVAYWLCVATLCLGVVFFALFVSANYRESAQHAATVPNPSIER